MRVSAIRRKSAASFEELKPACQVLILHEDFDAYSQAVEVCRPVMEHFADAVDFNFKCWNFIELSDPRCARHAAKTAGLADIIFLSIRSFQIPAELDRWLASHLTGRHRKDGVLVLVSKPGDIKPPALEKLRGRLEPLAARLHMDFLSVPPGDHSAVRRALAVPAALTAPGETDR
jgi:hypothetical protein